MNAEERRALVLALMLLMVGLAAKIYSRLETAPLRLEQDNQSPWSLSGGQNFGIVAAIDSLTGENSKEYSAVEPEKPKPPKGRKAPWTGQIALNSASSAELEQLPGIGPALAKRILEERARQGRFATPEDLLAVKGIGEKKLKTILEFLIFD